MGYEITLPSGETYELTEEELKEAYDAQEYVYALQDVADWIDDISAKDKDCQWHTDFNEIMDEHGISEDELVKFIADEYLRLQDKYGDDDNSWDVIESAYGNVIYNLSNGMYETSAV